MTSRPRVAVVLFTAHLLLIAFSTAAMVTVLNGTDPLWLSQEPQATVARLGWKYSGPLYVTLGALAGIACLVAAFGWRRSILVTAAAVGLSLCVELAGTTIGLPFGDYAYTPQLGYRILGRVPFPIPLSWFYMLVGSLTIVARLARAGDDRANRWRWACFAGCLLLAWDVSMDPAMVRTGHWVWGSGEAFRDAGLPSIVVAFFARDAFYGMPLSNWLGWFLTATVIARVMLAIAPPSMVASRLGPRRLPVLLYLANGLMPVALCIRDGLWWAAAIGAAAMALPAAFALASRRLLPFRASSLTPRPS
jgi:putative membrane protein